MKKSYKISPAIAWQSYDSIDLLIMLNREKQEFYFFQGSGRVIVDNILKGKEVEQIEEMFLQQYDEKNMLLYIKKFFLILQQEDIVYECKEEF